MFIINTKDYRITSAKNTMAKIGCDIDELIQAINELFIHILILPKNPIEIDIRFPNDYRQSVFDRAGENPLHIEVNNIDGFIPSIQDNEKILRTLNWKTSKPYKVAYTNPKQSHAKAHSTYTLALKSVLHEGKCEQCCPCGIHDLRRTYLNQEFYFRKLISQNTKIHLDDVFLPESDIKNIKNHIHKKSYPDFNDLGGYQVNPWSNSLIQDINALHRDLHKDGKIKKLSAKHDKKAREKIIKSWLEERWKDNKQATKECFNYASDIVDPEHTLNKEIRNLPFSDEEIGRNQKSATKLMLIIDSYAERHMKKQRGYRDQGENKDKLIEAGIKTDTIRQAIYSFIKAKK